MMTRSIDNKAALILKLLGNRYYSQHQEALFKPYPPEMAQEIFSISTSSKEVAQLLQSPAEKLDAVHYSWLIPKLRELPKERQPLAVALLTEKQRKKLLPLLGEDIEPVTLTPLGENFFAKELKDVRVDEVFPADFLPQTSLSPLLEMTKEDLTNLIDFFALFDLAEEIHHIVDKYLLEKIFTCLTAQKKQFLKTCLREKQKLVTQRLQLENWDGNCAKLQKLLHHKGLVRLGYAISGQHPDFIWHLTHILDSGRGEKLMRYINRDPIPGVTEILQKQVMKIWQLFGKE